MQITVEKVVWIALVLVVVAVVGLFLMGQVLTGAQQVGQKFYVRLINSQYSDAEGAYVISFRLVNTGEGGATITQLKVTPVGFNSGSSGGSVSVSFISPSSDSDTVSLDLGPKATQDITVKVVSGYVTGSKSLVITATLRDANGNTVEASQTIEIP